MEALDKALSWAKAHPRSAAVGGVSVSGLIVYGALALFAPSFPVPEGHLFTVARPRAPEGEWLDIDRIANLVRDALDRTVGPPRPLGSGSYPLKKWKDKTSAGKPYEVRAGIWLTDFHDAPAGSPYAALSLKVHFWIEHHEDHDTEGELHLAIVARARPLGGGDEVVLDRKAANQSVAEFLALLK